ncbi:MAG: septum site-determining protein MinD, partial [Clostridia bacterium]|nr:septum site-determining protein MinD [Clostridia bacterium]
INEASMIADVILIDAPAGIENGLHRAASAANEAIIVTTPHVSAIKDADRAISVLSTYGLKGMGVVVNRFRNDLFNKGEILDAESIAELLRVPLYGVIPESDKLGVYSNIISCGRDKVIQSYNDIKQTLLGRGIKKHSSVKSGIFRRIFG